MTIRALPIAESVSHGSNPISEALFSVTGPALELAVRAFERITRQLRMVERFDLERLSDVTGVARALR